MARAVIPVAVIPVNGGGIEDLVYTAATVDGFEFDNDGNTVIIIDNGDVSPVTVTAVSVPDPFGRLENTVLTIPAASQAVLNLLLPSLWNQGGGRLVHIDVSSETSLGAAALKLDPRK